MITDPPNPSQFLEEEEEPSKTKQADEGGSLMARYSSADGVRQVAADEVAVGVARGAEEISEQDNGRERLKRHRIEMAKSRVWIPDIWGQEELLKDWVDCSAFDDCLVPSGIMSARAALVEDGRRATSGGLRIENSYEKLKFDLVFRKWLEQDQLADSRRHETVDQYDGGMVQVYRKFPFLLLQIIHGGCALLFQLCSHDK
ncbi:hypothetical protein V6N13_010365 [Hibiscus sabdariffa]